MSDPAALAIGTAGLVLAACSLTWQAVTFRLTGSRVRVQMSVGVSGSSLGGLLHFAPDRDWKEKLDRAIQEHGGIAVLVLNASNIGRMAVAVDDVKAVIQGVSSYFEPGRAQNPVPGDVLNAGHRLTWSITLEPVQVMVDGAAAVVGRRRGTEVRMLLTLATGKELLTPERIVLEPTPRP